MKNASQHGFLENMSLQINIILFHVWVYLSGVYKYVQVEKISYTRGLFFRRQRFNEICCLEDKTSLIKLGKKKKKEVTITTWRLYMSHLSEMC